MIVKISVILMYLLCMITNGVISRKKIVDADSYYTGGRNVGAITSASAYLTTFFSAVMFSLCGSLGFEMGISVMWIGIMNALITGLFAWTFLAGRTRQLSEDLGVYTLPQIVEARLNSRFLRMFTAFVILAFLIPYSASVYQGISFIFLRLFDIPFEYCIIALAVVTALYVALGGNSAMMSNSVIQGVLILVCVSIYYIVFFKNEAIGGFKVGLQTLVSLEGGRDLVALFGGKNFLKVFATVILTSVGGCATPQLISKFISVEKTKIKTTSIIATVGCLFIAGGMYFVGGFSQIFFQKGYLPVPDTADKVMGTIMHFITNDFFFTLIFIMLLAASMSTLAALVLTGASALTEDLLPVIFKKYNLSDNKKITLARIFSSLFIVLSAIMSIVPNSIISLMSISWGMIASVCIGPYWYCIFSKHTNKIPAIISSIYGFIFMSIGVGIYGMPSASIIASISILTTIIIMSALAFICDRVEANKKVQLEK
ncbi:sodium:solute symporter [Alkalibaculum bacchi]|uniref:sodium:solute symporter family protein n=1 Tax=Alkalibaculum bacchi TaxID=645887 RepID=UPI0026EF7449|nr:sodium:solute symporter family protein [Alkalibaculum bacchi]